MGNFEKRNDTHIVIKKEYVLNLEEPEQIALEEMLYRISRSRAEDNKNPINCK